MISKDPAIDFGGGPLFAVFARERLLKDIRNVVLAGEATGLMHVADNKGECTPLPPRECDLDHSPPSPLWRQGGIAVRMDIGSTSFCFISSHLAAHEGDEYKARRIDDVVEILRAGHPEHRLWQP